MKGWIKLTVCCETEQSIQFKELDIPVKEEDYTYREELYQISGISSISLKPTENGDTVLYSHGAFCQVKESYEEILRLIELNKL